MKLKYATLAVFLALLFLLIFYFAYLGYVEKARYIFPPIGAEKGAELGQLGDYFGGVLNPLIGFFTVIFVFLTFLQQSNQLELAKKEHKINLLQSEHRYLYSELITLLEKSGFDVGSELLERLQEIGRNRNVAVAGDLGQDYLFSYYKLACEFLRAPAEFRLELFALWSSRLSNKGDNAFIVSRLIVNCKMLVCMESVFSELTPLLDNSPSVKLSLETELNLIKEVFGALSIDYVKTAKKDKEIVWLH